LAGVAATPSGRASSPAPLPGTSGGPEPGRRELHGLVRTQGAPATGPDEMDRGPREPSLSPRRRCQPLSKQAWRTPLDSAPRR
jgi:hypothetical protein